MATVYKLLPTLALLTVVVAGADVGLPRLNPIDRMGEQPLSMSLSHQRHDLIATALKALMEPDQMQQSQREYPACVDDDAACGYQQLNSRGLQKVPICTCAEGLECPLDHVNFFDRRTLRHGSDFYKFCKRRPALRACTPGQDALNTTAVYHGASFGTVLHDYHWMCECPGDYVLNQTSSVVDDFGLGFATHTTQSCVPAPICRRREACAVYSDTVKATLVKKGCACPRGTYCPTALRQAHAVEQYPRGTTYEMRCLATGF